MTASSLPLFDILTPFMLEGGGVRGRVVRLGSVADTILNRHSYPHHVAQLLGELLVAAALLSANLKSEGIFTIQVRGKGLVPLIVVDGVYGGQLRGYADIAPETAEQIQALNEYSPRALLGEGAYIAITLDAGSTRYQGIVALEGDSIAEALIAYFTNSEQLEVNVQLALAHDNNHWRAAGFMIERMPDVKDAVDPEEDWRYAKAIAATVTRSELLDPLLDAPGLLYRLFHERGVWIYDPHSLSVGCRCSRERILGILMGMPETDRADMVVDGKVDVHCQFCNKSEVFTPGELGLSAGN